MTEPAPFPVNRSVFRRMLKIVGYLLISLFAIIIALVGILVAYESEIKAAIISELNRHLKAEVKIDPKNIDVTILSTFPDCTLQFSDILMYEAIPLKKRDTLLFAARLNLHFNVKDLWYRNYTIKKVSLKSGVFKPVIFKDGKNNYEFWKEDNTSRNDSLSFMLTDISVSDMHVIFKNRKSHLKIDAVIQKVNFSGNFTERVYDMSSGGNILINGIVEGKNAFLKEKQLWYSARLSVKGNSYLFTKADIALNDMAVKLNGSFLYDKEVSDLKLKFAAPDLDITGLLSLLPASYKEIISEYSSTGNFYASGSLDYANSSRFALSSAFGVKSGTIIYKANKTELTSVNLVGELKYTNNETYLRLGDVSAVLKGDVVKGSCIINNFADPSLTLSANANLNLANLLAFYPVDTITGLSGNVNFDTRIEGKVSELKNNTFSPSVKLELEAMARDLQVQFKKDPKVYSVENVSLTARDREISVKDLRLRRGSSDLTLNGRIPGVFNYLFDRKAPLIISGTLSSLNLSLDDFINTTVRNTSQENGPLLPPNMHFSLDAVIKKFSFGKFSATNITGDIEIAKQKLMVSNMAFESMEGSATLDAYADNSKGRLDVVLKGDLAGINITRLFADMNNFSQGTLTDQNLKGLATAAVEFSGTWSNSLECDYSSIRSTSKLKIDRGELNDFKPLLSLARFVDVNDLKRIRFSSLESIVRIENSTITIPRTTIKNSALNVELWGTHTFNNDINYHIRLLISELLASKRKKPDDEFGPVEKDKDNTRSAFILMTGTVDNPVIKYDRQGLKEKIRNDIRNEKQNMKQILKEEFGIFKKDSLKKQKEESSFELEETPRPVKKALELKKKEEEDF